MDKQNELLTLTADIVAAHVSNNSVSISDVPTLVRSVHQALTSAGHAQQPQVENQEKVKPAVAVRSSVKSDHIVCLACGKKQKTLKRHIAAAHGMTPAEYREEFGLKTDYPMVAPEYSTKRSEMARSIGLGNRERSGPEAKKSAKRGKKVAAPPQKGG